MLFELIVLPHVYGKMIESLSKMSDIKQIYNYGIILCVSFLIVQISKKYTDKMDAVLSK